MKCAWCGMKLKVGDTVKCELPNGKIGRVCQSCNRYSIMLRESRLEQIAGNGGNKEYGR